MKTKIFRWLNIVGQIALYFLIFIPLRLAGEILWFVPSLILKALRMIREFRVD